MQSLAGVPQEPVRLLYTWVQLHGTANTHTLGYVDVGIRCMYVVMKRRTTQKKRERGVRSALTLTRQLHNNNRDPSRLNKGLVLKSVKNGLTKSHGGAVLSVTHPQ